MSNNWYAKKRDEKEAAYKAALERKEYELAKQLKLEEQTYTKAARVESA